MLLSHTDVVVADPAEWTVPPFGGVVHDGHVWGRGAVDMKGQVAASAVAVAQLARAGWRGNGDLIFCAVADEEVDVGCGLRWLVEAHPDAVRADYVLNEGGGQRIERDGRVHYTLGVGETLASTFAVETAGRSGHASTPSLADNALVALAPAIERLAGTTIPGAAPAALEPFVRELGGGAAPAELAERWRRDEPELAWLLENMLAGSIAPTVIEAARKSTVIPGRARLVCDARLLPGGTAADLEAAVRGALDGMRYDYELLETPVGGSASPASGPLHEILAGLADEMDPGATLVPALFAGFTDSHWMREAFGSVAYGFMPTRMPPLLARGLMHAADERIAIDDLGTAARLFERVARAVGAL
jgi:acetylornithine deacetylase/succinyl-diaminopimelate desuccinylase-like protein